jgi:hypothetical protein
MSENAALNRLERLLSEAERTVALIDRCRPLNTRAELTRLEASWVASAPAVPDFKYRPIPDLADTRRALDEVATLGARLGPLGGLYAARAEELGREAAVLAALGTPSFGERAACRYPVDVSAAGLAADACAARWAAIEPEEEDERVLAEDHRDPRSLVRILGSLIGSLKIGARVSLVPELASAAAAGDGVVLVRPGVHHTESAARRIALHEVVGHVLPRIVARAELLGLFRVGSASGTDDEEGRALFLEEREELLSSARRRELGVRHLGALAIRRGADWIELVRLVLQYGFAVRDALRLAARIARGGGLAREIVYLPAFFRVRTALLSEPALEAYLSRGRVSIAAARALRAEGFEVEGGDDGRVIGRLVLVPRRDVDLDARAHLRDRRRRENQIDAEPLVPLVAEGAIVPPGK